MRSLLLILTATLLSQWVGAEQLAGAPALSAKGTGASAMVKKMDELRKSLFIPAHRNVRLRDQATIEANQVAEYADQIKQWKDADFQNPRRATELRAFMELAVNALPYDEGTEIAESIAYLNVQKGTDLIYAQVMTEMAPSCQKDLVVATVAFSDCEERRDSDADVAVDQGRKPVTLQCKPVTASLEKCESKRIAGLK